MSIKKILVPYVSSEVSKKGFMKALEIAKEKKAKIILFTVVDKPWPVTTFFPIAAILTAQMFSSEIRLAQIHEECLEFEKIASENNVEAELVISEKMYLFKERSVSKTILDFALKSKIDMIVLGSGGLTGWQKRIDGSVAEDLKKFNPPFQVMVV